MYYRENEKVINSGLVEGFKYSKKGACKTGLILSIGIGILIFVFAILIIMLLNKKK